MAELRRDDELRCGLLDGKYFFAGLERDMWGSQFVNGSFPELRASACEPLRPGPGGPGGQADGGRRWRHLLHVRA